MAAKKKASGGPAGKEPSENAAAKEPLNRRLMKALSHPLRVTILDLMNEREWSPREIEKETGEALGQVSYHVKVLKDFELIEPTRTAPKRGAVEHFYRAVERAFVPSGMAQHIPKSAQSIIGNGIMDKIDKDVAASLKSGKFYARDDWHTSWTPVDLDGQGCEDAEKLCDEFVERFLKLEVEANQRRESGEGDGEHIWTTAAVLAFGSEWGQKEHAPKKKTRRKQKKKA